MGTLEGARWVVGTARWWWHSRPPLASSSHRVAQHDDELEGRGVGVKGVHTEG